MAEFENLTHTTVLADEAVAALFADDVAGGAAGASAGLAAPVYVDATFGGGGHSGLILRRLPADGRLLALDCDEMAARRAAHLFEGVDAFEGGRESVQEFEHKPARLLFARRNYSELAAVLEELALSNVRGVLFDLGVSSFQLDDGERGFSFNADAPLDMRMDRRGGQTAARWLLESSEGDICHALRRFGEEPEARRVARALFARRAELTTTGALAQAVVEAKRRPSPPGRHPATRTFQALRIAVNDELGHLQRGLEAARRALAVGGRLVVIAFHSLEDRIVKQLAQVATLPGIGRVGKSDLQASARMLRPSAAEVAANPRARSACMRVFTKTAAV